MRTSGFVATWLSMLAPFACGGDDPDPVAETGDTSSGTLEATDETPTTESSTAPSDDTTSNDTTSNDTTSNDSSTGDTSGESTGEPTCPEVEFVYNIGTDPRDSFECQEVLGTTNTCAVTQTGCNLEWGCNGGLDDLLLPGPIDAAGVYTSEGTYMGQPFPCLITFTTDPFAFEWQCGTPELECSGGGF